MDAENMEWASEPIAVIGMSCKFSGGANSPEKLWDLMASEKTGWSEIPEDRYNLKGVYHPNHERTSTVSDKPIPYCQPKPDTYLRLLDTRQGWPLP